MAIKEKMVLSLCGPMNETMEEDEEEFRSCCGDEDELKEVDEYLKKESVGNHDENSVKMYFKGMSIACPGYSGSRITGIGVVMERSIDNDSPILVQKKLEFYVEEWVADYLALLDGLSVAIQNDIRRVFAFTDSEVLWDQITQDEDLENPLLSALKQRILEQASSLQNFVLKFLPAVDLLKAAKLAQVAVGVVSFPSEGEKITETCSICFEEKLVSMMLKIKCSHKLCSHCMKTYVEGKIQSAEVLIKCPQSRCKYCISATECKYFLTVSSYEALEKALIEANILNSDKIYCPYPNCSVLLDPRECLSTRASSSSSNSDISCVECPACERFICADCGAPWHASITCEEYLNTPLEERDASDQTLHSLGQNNRMGRRCQQCRRMIALTHGCFHMTCWCGHEFCYSCGSEYRNREQRCQCAFWDKEEEYSVDEIATYPPHQFEQWAWESFVSLPASDAYTEQERSQLHLSRGFFLEVSV